MDQNHQVVKSVKEFLVLVTSVLFITLIWSCKSTSDKTRPCDINGKVMSNLLIHIKEMDKGYSRILENEDVVILNSGHFAEYFRESMLEECSSDIEKCADKLPNINEHRGEDETIEYQEKEVIEFTSLYSCDSNRYFMGMTYSCGIDCGSIELIILTKTDNLMTIESIKNIGQM